MYDQLGSSSQGTGAAINEYTGFDVELSLHFLVDPTTLSETNVALTTTPDTALRQ
jgi:hypothetical protein